MVAAPADGIQETYLETLDLTTSEQLKPYNKAIDGLPESDRYELTRPKWTDFYQELEDAVFTFGSKSAVMIVTNRYGGHLKIEFNNTI